jgi:ribonuclease J
MSTFTFYGGAGEIGGNMLLIDSPGSRFFLDFGMSFKRHGNYFSEFLQPRTSNALGDYLALDLIPHIDGLYRNDFLAHNKMRTSEKPAFDGILVSHAHLDHLGHVNLLHEDMPIFASSVAGDIARVLDELGSGSNSDFAKTTKSFTYYENKRGEISRIRSCRDPDIKYSPRNYPLTMDKGEFEVGTASVQIFPVDHSIIGASGYIAHVGGKTIGYTGDLRKHGRRPENTDSFVEAASSSDVDVLFIEGTNIDEERGMSESDVKNHISEMIVGASGKHIFASFPVRDTYRLLSFYEAAKDAGRKLAINFRQAYLLDILDENKFLESGKDIIPSHDDGLAIYLKKREYCLIGEDADPEEKARDYDKKERPYVGAKNQICWRDVRDNPGDYVLFLDNYSVQELVDIKPVNGSIYIKSQCEPFDAEMELDWGRIENWLNRFGLEMKKAHASGHISGEEIAEVIERVEPKLVVPMHTEKPELFRDVCDCAVLPPEMGKAHEI